MARRGDRPGGTGQGRGGHLAARASTYLHAGRYGACPWCRGEPHPGVAPVSKQQGAYVARVIDARAGGRPIAPFEYRDFGMLAIIGRSYAVTQLGHVKLSGLLAWVLWCFAHIYFLIGFRNRLFVMLNWAWNFLSSRRGARLIIAMGEAPMTDMEHAEGRSGRTGRE